MNENLPRFAKVSLKVANVGGNRPTIDKTLNKQDAYSRIQNQAGGWEHNCITESSLKTTRPLQMQLMSNG